MRYAVIEGFKPVVRKFLTFFVLLIFLNSATCFAGETTIRVWIMGGEAEAIPQLAEEFERENPGVKVRIQAISWGGSFEKLVAAFLGGAPPDVCQLGTTMMGDFHAMGALESLSDLFDSGKLSQDDFAGESLKTNLFDGQVFGVPWYVDTRIVYYRQEVLQKHGWSHFPNTWAEFMELGNQVMMAKRKAGDVDGFFASLQGFTFEMFYWQAGGVFKPFSIHEGIFEPDKLEKTLDFGREMRRAGFYGKPRDSGLDYITEFDQGVYEVAVSGPWMASDLKKAAGRLKNDWAAATLPADMNNSSFLGGSNLVLFKDSRHKELGRKFILFLSRPDIQEKWYRVSSDIPANLKAMERDTLVDDELIKVFRDQLKSARVPPSGKEWTIFWERNYRAFEDFEEGNRSTKEFVAFMNSSMADIVREGEAGRKPAVSRKFWLLMTVLPFLFAWLYVISGSKPAKPALPTGVGWAKLAIFLLPALIILAVFRLFPLSLAFVASLTDLGAENIIHPENAHFLGSANYSRLYFDEIFRQSIWNTLVFILFGVPLNILIALTLALIVDRFKGWARKLLALCFFLPSVVTTVASAVTWKWIYCQQSPINALINWLGIGPVGWLIEADWALPSLIIFAIWRSFGLSMIIILAAFPAIDKDLYESVRVDGGGYLHELRHVTLPGLRRTILAVFIGSVVANIQFFIEPYVLTGGGPKNSTMSILLYSYNKAFGSFQLGYASSVITLLFVSFCFFNFWQQYVRRKMEG